MTDAERLRALLDALRTIRDTIPDDAAPADRRWRVILDGVIAAFDGDDDPTRRMFAVFTYILKT